MIEKTSRDVSVVGAAGAHAPAEFREGTFVHLRSKLFPTPLYYIVHPQFKYRSYAPENERFISKFFYSI